MLTFDMQIKVICDVCRMGNREKRHDVLLLPHDILLLSPTDSSVLVRCRSFVY